MEALPCRWQQRRRAAGAGGAGYDRAGVCNVGGGRRQGDGPSCLRGPTGHSRWPRGDGHSLVSLHYRTTQRSTPTRQRLGECALLVPPCHCLLSWKSPSGAFIVQAGKPGPREEKGFARSHTAMWRQKQDQRLPAPSTPQPCPLPLQHRTRLTPASPAFVVRKRELTG